MDHVWTQREWLPLGLKQLCSFSAVSSLSLSFFFPFPWISFWLVRFPPAFFFFFYKNILFIYFLE